MSELAAEQAYIDVLYARLDALREQVAERLAATRRVGAVGTPQARSERDAFATLYEDRLAQLRGVEERLCFGRLDLRAGTRRYVGRIGLHDEDGAQLLVDWRAPAAQPFYAATAAAPGDVVRRRHLVTRARTVTAVEDEVLDLDALGEADAATLSGEGALLAALNAERTGRMRDIVATIQAEQDRIIRSDLGGVLVVEGGPGTGKTAVALHRAAYLLYTHRDRLARSGVLVLGPNPTFLRYIEQVLPSLGETGVLLATVGSLLPGVDATGVEDERVAAVKGDLRMAEVLDAAIRARQRVPAPGLRFTVQGHEITLAARVVAAARDRARRRRVGHNVAREKFLLELLDHLARELATGLGVEFTPDTRGELLAALRESRDVRRELNLLWLPLTPQRVLADLWADPAQLAQAAPALTGAERRLLRRQRDAPWTPADVPLLDEIAELLGDDELAAAAQQGAAAEQHREAVGQAREALRLGGGGIVTAEMLAERFAEPGPVLTAAERAAADRTWAFGHVVVDEAQELSPMAWRMVMRRCPSRSMTVVGDLAQTSALAGARSWAEVLDPYAAGRWRLERLTVNYRTPRQVMDLATRVLAAARVPIEPPRSAREAAVAPSAVRVRDLPVGVVAVVADELPALGAGRLAVITPRGAYDRVQAAVAAAFGDRVGRGLEAPVSVLTVVAAKGLEVDVVVLVEPAAILAGSARGAADLYVALTRPTQRLRVVHRDALPAGMEGLARVSAA